MYHRGPRCPPWLILADATTATVSASEAPTSRLATPIGPSETAAPNAFGAAIRFSPRVHDDTAARPHWASLALCSPALCSRGRAPGMRPLVACGRTVPPGWVVIDYPGVGNRLTAPIRNDTPRFPHGNATKTPVLRMVLQRIPNCGNFNQSLKYAVLESPIKTIRPILDPKSQETRPTSLLSSEQSKLMLTTN